jgi:hypothetical protein
MALPTLYCKSKTGKTQVWNIETIGATIPAIEDDHAAQRMRHTEVHRVKSADRLTLSRMRNSREIYVG